MLNKKVCRNFLSISVLKNNAVIFFKISCNFKVVTFLIRICCCNVLVSFKIKCLYNEVVYTF